MHPGREIPERNSALRCFSEKPVSGSIQAESKRLQKGTTESAFSFIFYIVDRFADDRFYTGVEDFFGENLTCHGD